MTPRFAKAGSPPTGNDAGTPAPSCGMLAFKLGGIEPPAASTCRRSRTISSSYCGEGRVSTQHEHEKMREGKDKGSKILAGTGRDREGRVAAGGKTVFFKVRCLCSSPRRFS